MRTDPAKQRGDMVKSQLVARGIRDPAVLRAMRQVPREKFVPSDLVDYAYEDSPLPIGERQTISQPYMVAMMAEALELAPQNRVLEIGTGSGYAAAVLSRIVRQVYTVERHATLAREAEVRFRHLGYANIQVKIGDGTLGWPEHAPFGRIVVTAGGPRVPEPLQEQLGPGGYLVIPVGSARDLQQLVRLRRIGEGQYRRENLGSVRFVPLVGQVGWEQRR